MRCSVPDGGGNMKWIAGVFVVISILLCPAPAQASTAPPEPTPEQKKLQAYVGDWAAELHLKPSILGPGGTLTGHATCDWLSGRFHVVCRSTWKGDAGEIEALAILTHDDSQKAYTVYQVASRGSTALWKGNLEGDTWTYDLDSIVDGQPIKVRITEKVTPDVLFWREELAIGDGPWTVVGEGKEIRTHEP
jgi:hypothetical protein